MHIIFLPHWLNETLTLSKQGETLIINGDPIDLSVIPDGATLPGSAIDNKFIADLCAVERIDGELHVTVLLPHGLNPPSEVAFPEPITVMADGPIQLPGANDGDD